VKKKRIAINFAGPLAAGSEPGSYPFKSILESRYEVEISDRPDYLFVTQNPKSYRALLLRYDSAPIRIFNSGEAIVPDFNLCDYGIGFDPIGFGDRYFNVHPFVFFGRGRDPEVLRRPKSGAELLRTKERFCDFIYSNPWAHPLRDRFFEQLGSYKTVDSAGRHLKNCDDLSFDAEDWERPKLEFQRRYKFSIAFENARHVGYTTEKLIHPLLADSVPIYWGNPEVGRYFNPNAFVDANRIDSLDELIDRVQRIDGDDALYASIVEQPGFTEEQVRLVEENRRGLEAFLYALFDQPVEKARRRGHGFWNDNYEERFRQRVSLERTWVGKGYTEWRRTLRRLFGRR
jgi:hypothetical protein